jgi:mannose-6-phosphate isomerase-like protein (cupin superfamily)
MSNSDTKTNSGANFAAADLGTLAELGQYRFKHPAVPGEVEGKVFLHALLGLTSAEISLNRVPPGFAMPFHHRHRRNEEIYIFIKGRGEFQVDDRIFPVGEGSVVRVAPDGARWWRNTSDKPLYYIVVQAPVGGLTAGATISDGMPAPNPATG